MSSEDNCEGCYCQDDQTGACTNDGAECIDGSEFVKDLTPEDMYKALYLLIYSMPFTIQKHVMEGTIPEQSFAGIPVEVLEKFDEERQKILISYDRENKRFILETSQQPEKMKPILVKVPKKILRRRQKLFIPGQN